MTYLTVGTGGLLFRRFRTEVKKGASFTLMTHPGVEGGRLGKLPWFPPQVLAAMMHPKGVRGLSYYTSPPPLCLSLPCSLSLLCPVLTSYLVCSWAFPEPQDRPNTLGIKGRRMYQACLDRDSLPSCG